MAVNVLRIFIFVIFLGSVMNISSENTGDMVLVKGGAFSMGTKELFCEEEPIHNVMLSNFYIGKFEVTQEEWKSVMENNPSLFEGDRNPVELVTWYDAVEYCNKKSVKEGRTPCYSGSGANTTCNFTADGYRLPTEAEWEFAARGGLKSRDYKYIGGDNPGEVAWYDVNSGDKPQPIGKKKPNELGIYDMGGNVWEWCWDWYDNGYYKNSPAENPTGPASGKARSYRGGSVAGRAVWLRSTARFSITPGFSNYIMGFRVVTNDSGKQPEGLIFVKGGRFDMGAGKGQNGEKLIHDVTVGSFFIGKYEVTQAAWRAVMKNNPSLKKGAKSPINYVDWNDAVEYCNRRSLLEGLTPCYSGSSDNIACNFQADGYRLPTEAEWEFAARGGTKSGNYKYSGSNNLDEVAWHNRNSGYLFRIHASGRKKPNELGIYDMSGSVMEWCWDRFDFYYYDESPGKNPLGPSSGADRVVRGGSWLHSEEDMWNATRSSQAPVRKLHYLGFRVARNAK
jgi:formylglycine-generating enzyme required for sulfatase activity